LTVLWLFRAGRYRHNPGDSGRGGKLLKEAPLVPNFKIVVNEKALSRNLATAVNRLAVENEINVPAMFMIRFNTGDYLEEYRQVGELESFKQGDRIGIFMGMDQTAAMMDGEVVALEWGFGDTPFLEVRGYDLLHRLRFGTRDRYFEKQKNSQILKFLAAEAGLNLKAEDSATIRPYISQINQSNFQFIKDLAQLNSGSMKINSSSAKRRNGKDRISI
jgi:phage protein D